MSQDIIIISALAQNNVIGKENKIPWYIKEDFKLFKEHTSGHVIIMGRNTWESLPIKPLPNRVNIIISKKLKKAKESEIILDSIDEAIMYTKRFYPDKKVFLIGGSSIYREGLEKANYMFLSHVKKEYEGDTFFPEFNETNWEVKQQKDFEEFIFKIWKKK